MAEPYSVTVIRDFRPESGHSNEMVYCKLIDRRLKTLLKEELDSFLEPTTTEFWKFYRISSAFLWIKKHKYKKILKKTFVKKKFPQSQKNIKKYSSKYNGCRSVVNIAENFDHVQN